MSQELAKHDEARRRKAERLLAAIDSGLREAIAHMGGELVSYSTRDRVGDCLVTLRIQMPAGSFIAFVGSETPSGAILKATNDALADALKLQVDKFARAREG